MPSIKEYTLYTRASTDELERIRDFVMEHARRFGFQETDVNDIVLAVDEACTNIIKHSCKENSNKKIYLCIELRNNEMLVSITDYGNSFDPENYSMPSIQEQLEHKKRSGYGILLIRKLMDNVEYRNRKSRNEIRMTKKR